MEEGGIALKELYLRKFFSGTRPSNTLEKVISFQQKLSETKNNKHPIFTNNTPIDTTQFLQEESNRFRPSTNHTSHHPRRERPMLVHQHKRHQGPALAELRLILDRKEGNNDILTDGRTEKSSYTAQGNRIRTKLLSQREISSSEPEQRISKINMANFLEQRKLSNSEKKTRPVLFLKKQHLTVKQNHNESDLTHKTVSKKVFIGGRDLEKAAQEYFKHYRQKSKKIENAQAEKRQKMSLPISERRIIDKSRSSRRGYKKSKVIIPSQGTKSGHRTQPKTSKYQDMIINLDLDPWNVEADYF